MIWWTGISCKSGWLKTHTGTCRVLADAVRSCTASAGGDLPDRGGPCKHNTGKESAVRMQGLRQTIQLGVVPEAARSEALKRPSVPVQILLQGTTMLRRTVHRNIRSPHHSLISKNTKGICFSNSQSPWSTVALHKKLQSKEALGGQ